MSVASSRVLALARRASRRALAEVVEGRPQSRSPRLSIEADPGGGGRAGLAAQDREWRLIGPERADYRTPPYQLRLVFVCWKCRSKPLRFDEQQTLLRSVYS